MNPRTVAQRVKAAGILPGPDGKFATREIHSALWGDVDREKLRKLQAETRSLLLANAEKEGQLVDVADFTKRLERIIVQMKARIMSSELSNAKKDQLCSDLAALLAV